MRTVQATVNGQIVLHDIDPKTISRLRRSLSFPNPEYQTAVQFGEEVGPDVPERLCCVTENADGSVAVPRGTIYELKALLTARQLRIEFFDSRSRGRFLACPEEISKPLRGYQQEGVTALVQQLQGSIVLPCGGGKTAAGIGAIAALARTTLILVHTIDLVNQWAAAIKELLNMPVSIFAAGKRDIGPITVATVQSLVAHPETDLSSFGFCIIDECHSLPAKTCQAVLQRCPARWRLGLTATPKRSDGLTKMIDWSLGERLLEKDVPELASQGWLVLPAVKAIYTDFEFDCTESEGCQKPSGHRGDCDPEYSVRYRVNDLRKRLVANAKRNNLVADTVAAETGSHTSLVLSNDKAHCELLRQTLCSRGLAPVVITSAVAKKKRQQMLSGLRDGSVQIAIATSLADQGLDVPRLSRVFLALPERSQGRTKQRVGRLMRPCEQQAKLVDFVDHNVATLKSRWRSRRSVFRKLGLEISE